MRWMGLVTGLLACSGGGEPDSGPAPDAAYPSTFDGVAAMMEDHCVRCHGPGGQADFLPLPDIVGLELVQGEPWLVVPGDPDNSRLWQVLQSGAMPLDTDGLPHFKRSHVEAWIAAGADHPYGGIDLDGDGFTPDQGDCDETNAAVRPSAMEVCGDGLDNDCSGSADGPDATDASPWYVDGDGDGYGDRDDPGTLACSAPAGAVAEGGDCDDADPDIHPDLAELMDGVDQDCDGFVDELTSHATDIEPLYTTYCSCHVSGIAGVLDLGPDGYANLVDVPSTQLPSMDLVEPFDPTLSYLWQKLKDTQLAVGGTGDQMPKSAPPLDGPTLMAVEAWILEGAPP